MEENKTVPASSKKEPAEDGGVASSAGALAVPKRLKMVVMGVGGAGGNCVASLSREALEGVGLVALNTAVTPRMPGSASSVAEVQLGSTTTRGLGTGGDPEVGRAAAESTGVRLRELCQGNDIVIILSGMGGGTGTGAAPVVARVAKEMGALVLCVVTTPFSFEGTRRQRQAAWGVEQLKAVADAVICLPNQKLLGLAGEEGPVLEVFRVINEILAEGVRSLFRMLTKPGIMHVDFNDLCSVLKGRHAESSMASAQAGGENRAADIVGQVVSSPFINGGQALREADAVLVSFVGGSKLSIAEVNRVMGPIQEYCGNAHVFVGASIDPDFEDRLAVTLIASKGGRLGVVLDSAAEGAMGREPTPGGEGSFDVNRDTSDRSVSCTTPFGVPGGGAELSMEKRTEILKAQEEMGGKSMRNGRRLRQSLLPLEIVSRGRFEKSEPTLHRGEDLDVPTYIRRGVSLN